jgi:hypothetical protein
MQTCVIRCPSIADDNIKDTVWILGCIDNSIPSNFYIVRVENRRINTITKTLESVLCVGTEFLTDGYSSYKQVAINLGLKHKVVNYSEGFKAADCTQTN